jgi:hypothetical protein
MASNFSRALPALAALSIAIAGDASAQAWGIATDAAFRRSWTDNTPLGDPIGAAITLRRANSGRTVWVEAERLQSTSHRHGPPCGGFIQPGTCADEPLEDRARHSSVAVGLTGALHRNRWLALDLVGAVRGAYVSADTRGLSTGQQISASKVLWGVEGGLDVVMPARSSWPLVLVLSGRLRGLIPVSPIASEDDYQPFGAIGARTLQIGLRWRSSE